MYLKNDWKLLLQSYVCVFYAMSKPTECYVKAGILKK